MSAPKQAEQWRPIPGFSGYEVSDKGRVLSRLKWRGTDSRILRLNPNPQTRYMQLGIRRDGQKVTVAVHALVLLAFVGRPPPEGHEVRHIDGDRQHNALTNLAYGTHVENEADKFLHGTHNMASRTHCKHSHEFTPENTVIWRSNGSPYRQCLTCSDGRRARYMAKKKGIAA